MRTSEGEWVGSEPGRPRFRAFPPLLLVTWVRARSVFIAEFGHRISQLAYCYQTTQMTQG